MPGISVERHQLLLPAGTTTAEVNLSADDVTECVPFITRRLITAAASPPDDFAQLCTDAYFETGPNKLKVETTTNTPRYLAIEATVVQFDAARYKVQQDTFTIADGQSFVFVNTPDIEDITHPAFMYFTWKAPVATTDYPSVLIRGQINRPNTEQLAFDRTSTTGTVTGHWYIVESLNGADFTVQESDINVSDAAGLDTITSIDRDKTWILGSWTGQSGNDDNDVSALDVVLASDTTITATRNSLTGDCQWHGYAVTFTGAGQDSVQRGTSTALTGPFTQEISQVDTATAMPMISGNMGCCVTGANENSDGTEVGHISASMDCPDSTTVRGRRYAALTDPTTLSWQIVQWDTSATGVQRVMVSG